MASDLGELRLRNTLLLLDLFKEQVAPGTPDLHGLEKAFALNLGISSSYWSQLKNPDGPKNIGDKLARQFERKFRMPLGWLDKSHKNAPILPGSLTITASTEAEADFLRAAQAIFRRKPGTAKAWAREAQD